eukprot:3134263-Amphidinium_carterae.1
MPCTSQMGNDARITGSPQAECEASPSSQLKMLWTLVSFAQASNKSCSAFSRCIVFRVVVCC